MNTFKKDLSFGLIKEVGEDDILVNVNGQDMEIQLDDSTRKPIYDATEEGLYIVPVDVKNKKLLMTVDTETIYEVFPEADLKELKGATEDYPKSE